MKARAIKDLHYSWYLKDIWNSFKLHSPKGLYNLEKIFKYHLKCKSLIALAFVRLSILIKLRWPKNKSLDITNILVIASVIGFVSIWF